MPLSDADLAAIRDRWTGDFSDKSYTLPGDPWEDIPALLAEVYLLRAELDALEARETTAFLAARDRAEAAEAEVERLRAKETESWRLELAWREGYYTGKRDYAGSVMGGQAISTPNPYAQPVEGGDPS